VSRAADGGEARRADGRRVLGRGRDVAARCRRRRGDPARSGARQGELPRRGRARCRDPGHGRGCRTPWLRSPQRERRVRRSGRGGGSHVRRSVSVGAPRARGQDRGAQERARRRARAAARQRRSRRPDGRGRIVGRSRTHRISGAGEGSGRGRWHRHAGGTEPRRTRGRGEDSGGSRAPGLPRRTRVPRAVPRQASAHRAPDGAGPPWQRGLPRGTRVQRTAPPPEGDRGEPNSGGISGGRSGCGAASRAR
jgi:hypothetical protein